MGGSHENNDINSYSQFVIVNLTDTFRRVNNQMSNGRVRASFYPYKELKHSWRTCDGALSFRVSDYMKGVPDEVMESLAWHLLCRARKKECPKGMAERYTALVHSRDFWEPRRLRYLSRSRNLSFRPKGNSRDLGEVFSYVNEYHFGSEVSRPDLAWIRESPRSRVGFYHPPLRILAVNRALDSDYIPRFVLEFVMYHELLHDRIGPSVLPSRSIRHTKEFRTRERQFSQFDLAQEWLRKISKGGNAFVGTDIVPQA